MPALPKPWAGQGWSGSRLRQAQSGRSGGAGFRGRRNQRDPDLLPGQVVEKGHGQKHRRRLQQLAGELEQMLTQPIADGAERDHRQRGRRRAWRGGLGSELLAACSK